MITYIFLNLCIFTTTATFEPLCQPEWDPSLTQNIIANIEKKIFLNSVQSFYCQYTVYTESFFIYDILYGKTVTSSTDIKQYITGWIGNTLGKQPYFSHIICEEYPKEPPPSPTIPQPSQVKEKKQNKNLIELLKSKLEDQQISYYNYINSKNKTIQEDHPDIYCTVYYLYNNIPYNFVYYLYNDGTIKIQRKETQYLPGGVPLFFYCGQLYYTVSQLYDTGFGASLVDFLKLPGPYYISEEDGYIKLWHVQYPVVKDNRYPLQLEVWLYPDYKIFRIDYVNYLSRSFSKETFEKVKYSGTININNPKKLIERMQIDEYLEWGENIHIPVKGFYEHYAPDLNYEEAVKIETAYREGKISHREYLFEIVKFPTKINLRESIVIDKTSIRINDLNADFFTPPQESMQESIEEQKITIKRSIYSKLFILISGCVIAILIVTSITRKYFGWGL